MVMICLFAACSHRPNVPQQGRFGNALSQSVKAHQTLRQNSDPQIGKVYYFASLPEPLAGRGALARIVAISNSEPQGFELVTERESLKRGVHFFISGDYLHTHNIAPLATDARLRRARLIYEGHKVWSFGKFYITCESYIPVIRNHGPVRIHKIVRLSNFPATISLGPAGYLNGANVPLSTSSPLVVFFDPPASDVLINYAPGPAFVEPTKRCVNQWILADDWQLDVSYSLAPPEESHPKWTRTIRDNIAAARIVPGMTHAMVAWALGFPSQQGTRAQLMRAQVWQYPMPPPGGATVYFRNDRVFRYEPPRMLP